MPQERAAFRAVGTSSFTANNVSASTNLTPGLPTRSNGDLLLCFTWSRSITAACATPSGWTLISGFPKRSVTTSGGGLYVFAIVVDGTESAPTCAWTSLTSGTSGDASGAIICSYSGVDVRQGAQLSIDAPATISDQAGSTTTVTVPAITTVTANSLRIAFVLKLLESGGTWTPPSSFGERSDLNTSTGTGHTAEIADLLVAAIGSTGTTTAAPSVTTSSQAIGVSFSLRSVFDRRIGMNYI